MKIQELTDGSGLPALGLGTWKSPADDVYRAVRTAIEVGYRHIDCAAIYQNEEHVGRALEEAFRTGDVTREQIWVTSKLWNDSHAPEAVRPALESSLKKLRLERLDLYLMHWPVALRRGVLIPRSAEDFLSLDQVPLEATWEAMLKVCEEGLAAHVGVSNFSAPKIRRIREATGKAPAVNQIELHPYLQQDALLAACKSLGVAVTAYSPLGSPDSAEFFGRKDDVLLTEHPTILQVAEAHDATPGQVLIAWALSRGTSVIPKSVNPSRIAENWGAQDLTLAQGDIQAIAELDAHRRMVDARIWYLGETYSPETFWDETDAGDA